MLIASARIVLSKKLFNDKSNVHYKLLFPGNFLEMLGGGGQIIRHSHNNLHIFMVILPDFHKQQSYQYFHIWCTVSKCLLTKILDSNVIMSKILEIQQKSRNPLNLGPWSRLPLISMRILMFGANFILFYIFGIISVHNCPIYKI